MPTISIEVDTPEWATPLLAPRRYKGAKGGRSSGKSHFFAELAVEEMTADPDLRFVCIREVQRSLKFSAKALVEAKIRALGLGQYFHVLEREIRRRGGTGIMIFEGMQDHTADSLKSLEGFSRAWVEEAQNLSRRSMELLLPTIRAPGSEIWFSWNPSQPDDPVDQFLVANPPDNSTLVHVNYLDNPWCPEVAREEARRLQRVDPEAYAHVWLGEYATRSDAQVLSGKWRVDEFEVEDSWDGPYFGADWGFSRDPTVLVRCWLGAGRLWVDYDVRGVKWDNDETARRFRSVPGAQRHRIRGDSARPETIHEMNQRGFSVEAAPKWGGSVEDGIQFLRSFEEIVIHERCASLIAEARMWRYKLDKQTGDPLPKLVDADNHGWDAVRYALSPLIRRGGFHLATG